MKLNLEIWDVEIHTGKPVHYTDVVFIAFRRQPDSDVIADLMSLESEYGWKVEDIRGQDAIARIMTAADFRITCTGAISSNVGNEIAKNLEIGHGLRCRKVQIIGTGTWGIDKDLYYVEQLRNPSTKLTDKDIPVR